MFALFLWVPFVGTISMIGLGFYKVRPKLTTLLNFVGCFLRFHFWIILHVFIEEENDYHIIIGLYFFDSSSRN